MSEFIERVKETIAKYNMLEPNDKVIVGVSGGPDSVALLYILNSLKEYFKLKLWVIHVNHMFRGEEAEQEAKFVADLALAWGIPCEVFVKNVPAIIKEQGLSPSEAGHKIRKKIYREAAKKTGANKLALGHHADDRAETVLLHLIQGTGLDGLASMPPRHGWLIRPLANMPKEHIVKFCHEKKIPYCLDPSNAKPVYLRNKIRLELLPFLQEKYNPQMVTNLLKLEDIVLQEIDYLEAQVEEILENIIKKKELGLIRIDLEGFNQQHIAVKRRVVRKIFKLLKPDEQNLGYTNIEQVIELCISKGGTKELHLPHNIILRKGYTTIDFLDGYLHSLTEQKYPQFNYSWEIPESLSLAQQDIELKGYYTQDPPKDLRGLNHIVLDSSKVKVPLTVRQRKPGDRLQPLGMVGTKKVKDIFIDKKIAKEHRETIPIVCSGDDIIWIPGITVNNKYIPNSSCKDFLVLELVKTEYV